MTAPPAVREDRFERALLESERRRLLALIVAYAVVLGFGAIRETLVGWTVEVALAFVAIALVGIGQEVFVLTRVRAAMRERRVVTPWVWTVNVVAECLAPTLFIVILAVARDVSPVDILSYPVAHSYYIFIALSTLHLAPRLCVLGGFVSAIGYGAVTIWIFSRVDGSDVGYPAGVYATTAVIMVVVGLSAAAVSREIRRYVERAIGEAETRGQMERDLDIARSIQSGLLPEEPLVIGNVEVAGRSEPADQTGGDYFDWQVLPGGRLAVSLADVTGHGIGPALVAAVCRAYTRATVMQRVEPSVLANAVNSLLSEDLPDDRFVTFVLGIVDTKTYAVDLLAAGHGPVMHVRGDHGTINRYAAQGIPLGVISDFSYEVPPTITLDAGDALVFLTDGLFEQSDAAGEDFGLDRIQEVLLREHGQPAQRIVDALFEALDAFAKDTPRKDDVTAVVVRRVT